MNFTIEILEPVDAYGSWDKENETWNGVIGQLISGEIDIGVAEFTVTTRRLEAVDFTLPFLLSRNRLYMMEPSGASVQWSAYFKVFPYKQNFLPLRIRSIQRCSLISFDIFYLIIQVQVYERMYVCVYIYFIFLTISQSSYSLRR